MFMAAGFKPIVGVPLGQLFDAPGIVAEASAFASSVQSKESKKQGRPVEVEYDFVMAGDHLHVRSRTDVLTPNRFFGTGEPARPG